MAVSAIKFQCLFKNYQVNPIRILKLFLISVVVFSVMLFCLSLIFPSTTYVSRAVNVKGERSSLNNKIPELYTLAFHDNADSLKALQRMIDSLSSKNFGPMREGEFTRSTYTVSLGDTLIFTSPYSSDIGQAVSIYTAGSDSTTVQVFYKIHVPFYKPWQKFALMLNESKYGPSLDSAISRISQKF